MIVKKFSIVVVVLLINTALSSAGKPKENFFERDKGGDGEDKKLQFEFSDASGGGGGGKQKPSATKFQDDLSAPTCTIGDRSTGGLPDTQAKMSKYCVEYIMRGLAGLGYVHVRYLHKFVLKGMFYLLVIGMLKTNGVYCANAQSMAAFVAKARIVNSVNDEIADMREKLMKRAMTLSERSTDGEELTKMSCCTWREAMRKLKKIIPEEAREFVVHMMEGYFGTPANFFCGKYPDGPVCEAIDFDEYDSNPTSRPVYKAIITSVCDVVEKFV